MYYANEEEFLDKYFDYAAAASEHLGGDWKPNLHASDKSRHNIKYRVENGTMDELAFESASVDTAPECAVHIFLVSSKRKVSVKVTDGADGKHVATTVADIPR